MKILMGFLVLSMLVLLWGPQSVEAGGGTTPGSSFINCATSEPTIASEIHTLICDDFERSRNTSNTIITGVAPVNPGTFVIENCDNPAAGLGLGQGEAYPPNKGWCSAASSNPASLAVGTTTCAGAGANATNCTTRHNLNDGPDVVAVHNFPGPTIPGNVSTCPPGLNAQITNGVCHYDEAYFRMYLKWASLGQVGDNQKILSLDPCCTGTGGIFLGAPGMLHGDSNICMIPVEDKGWYDLAPDVPHRYVNPQAVDPGGVARGSNCQSGVTTHNYSGPTGQGCECLGQNSGNGVLDTAGSRVGRWTAIEFHFKLNSTSGAADGIYEVWMDDCGPFGQTCPTTPTLRGRYTNVAYRGPISPENNQFTKIGEYFLDTWTATGGDCGSIPCGTQSGVLQIDQVVASTQRIGWMNSTILQPPSAPSALTVTTP